jgi:hypothetical protein
LTRRIKIPSFIPPWRDIMKEIFKKLIVDFIDRDQKTLIPREYAIPVDSGH